MKENIMKRRMYWGVAILILLLIGVSVFLLSRTTETEPEEVYNPLTPSEKEQVDRNIQDAIEKSKQNQPLIVEEPISDSIESQDVQVSEVPDKKAQQNDNTDIKPRNYVEIDYSILDNPEETIRRHAEIMLNRDKYSYNEYFKAAQEDSFLSTKILDGYYGKGEYFEHLRKFRKEILVNPLLAKQGLSIEMFQSMIKGEIPPMVIPLDSVDIRH